MDHIFIAFLLTIFMIAFVMLVKGADIFIDGAASIAMRRGVSEHLIGLTLVAFATSIPELAVSDIAAFQGVEGIAIGNVVGSNIANIGLVLGVAIFIMPVAAPKQSYYDGLILMGITSLLAVLIYWDGELDRIDGLIFLAVYVAFSYYLIRSHFRKNGKAGMLDHEHENKDEPLATEVDGLIKVDKVDQNAAVKDWMMLIGGAAMVLVGAHFLVNSAVEMAEMAGITEFIIGLTIVSIGTSLPEMASSVSAALKHKHGISVGNVIGSNIINILLVLGTAATIRPIATEGRALDLSMPFLFLFTIICVVLVKTRMPKAAGLALLVLYGVFVVVLAFCGGV